MFARGFYPFQGIAETNVRANTEPSSFVSSFRTVG